MVKELVFEKNGKGESVAKFVSTGTATVQIQRTGMAVVSVSGNIPGMPPCVTGVYQNVYNNGILFGVDFPVGIEVTLTCGCGVTLAKLMSND